MNIKYLLSKLVSFETITADKKKNLLTLNWIKKQLYKLPLFFVDFKSNDYSSLLITTQKTKKPLIWLVAHVDVVPATKKQFMLNEKSGKLFGRGTYDMHFATASYLLFLLEIGQNLPKYNFGIMLTSDEEIGGFDGVGALLKKGYSAKVAFLPDGGEDFKIEKLAKGIWQFKVESHGVSAHASRPWLAKSATENLIDFLHELKDYFPQEPCKDKDHAHSTINIGKISGGDAINKIPDYAEASMDIRFISRADLEEINGHINKLQLQKRFNNIKIKKIDLENCLIAPIKNKYFRDYQQILKKAGIKSGFTISHGASDARFFAKKHIPVILTRPKGGGHHSENEWIDAKELEKFYQTLKEFVLKTSKI